MRLVKVGDFDAPLYVTAPPGDKRRLFVVEQAGEIVRRRGGGKPQAQPFLDIRSKVTAGGEQGLLSMAFAAGLRAVGPVLRLLHREERHARAIWEYRRASDGPRRPQQRPARAAHGRPRAQPQRRPDDLRPRQADVRRHRRRRRRATTSTAPRGNAQSLSSLLGKILRIDPRQSGGKAYTIPSSNPFVGRAGARGEIYSYGLRNPWRFSFDRANRRPRRSATSARTRSRRSTSSRRGGGRGANFGWRPWEGRRRNFNEPAPHAIFPVITHTHQAGFCSITGGYVVRDRGVPGLYGRYVYGDYCNSHLRVATLRAGRRAQSRTLSVPPISGVASFGEDASGRLYVVSLNGPVYRFAAR